METRLGALSFAYRSMYCSLFLLSPFLLEGAGFALTPCFDQVECASCVCFFWRVLLVGADFAPYFACRSRFCSSLLVVTWLIVPLLASWGSYTPDLYRQE